MTDHKNIQEAMLAIYKSVGYVQKTKSENLNYKFASETGFIQEIRPAMVENGVTVSVSKMDNLTQESYTTKSGAVMMRSTIHGVVTFSHVSGS
jgi:Zn-dependent M16 (insulinase) family peptidase